MRKVLPVAILLLSALIAGPALAQEESPQPITWVGFSQLQPGKSSQDAVALSSADKDFMDGLVANGTILSYGSFTAVNHRPDDDWNYGSFVTVESWEKIGAWVGAFMGYVNALPEKQREARAAADREVFVDGSHYDWVVRHVAFKPGSTPPQFFYMAHFTVADGKADEVVPLFDSLVAKTLEPLQQSGDMGSMGVYVPEIHGEHGWTHTYWYALSGLGAIDKMQEAFQSGADRADNAWAQSILSMKGHEDRILLVVDYGGPESSN